MIVHRRRRAQRPDRHDRGARPGRHRPVRPGRARLGVRPRRRLPGRLHEGVARCAELIDDPLPLVPNEFLTDGRPTSGNARSASRKRRSSGSSPTTSRFWPDSAVGRGSTLTTVTVVESRRRGRQLRRPAADLGSGAVCATTNEVFFDEPFAASSTTTSATSSSATSSAERGRAPRRPPSAARSPARPAPVQRLPRPARGPARSRSRRPTTPRSDAGIDLAGRPRRGDPDGARRRRRRRRRRRARQRASRRSPASAACSTGWHAARSRTDHVTGSAR